MFRKSWFLILFALLSSGISAFLVGCGDREAAAPDTRVLMIGLDGAEWSLLGPMMDAGEMPNLARLRDRGVHGKLRSLEPLAKSPAIWTTIATGKSPQEHGIEAFVDQKGDAPLTQNIRKVRALWNIVGAVGKKVGVVGWLMSWPAEEVNGFVVSDYLQYGPRNSERFEGRTYPAALEQELAHHVARWEDLPWSAVTRFLSAPLDTLNMPAGAEGVLRPMRWITAGDLTFAGAGLDLYEKERPEFFAVYLRGMDAMGHLYWNYMQPEAVPPGLIDPRFQPYLGDAMRNYYQFVDELVGPFLDIAERDPNTTVIVVSDHGFVGGTGRGVDAHNIDGVILMGGRGVGQGEITGANVYDITPTTLVLLGLPPAADMKGKVLWSALDPAVIPRDRFRQEIPTYETGDREGQQPMASPVDEEIKERLKSLGYID